MPRGGSTPVDAREVLSTLSGMPGEFARIARGRTDASCRWKPQPDVWCAQEVLAHLCACADVWGRSIDRMIAGDHPTIRYVSPRGWIRKTDYPGQEFSVLLAGFTLARAAVVDRLAALGPKGWGRGATFTGTTLGRNATVLGYATRIAEHEMHHLPQLRRALRISEREA